MCSQAPIYNFKTSSREGYRTIKVPESRVVIVEGIYALSEKIRCDPEPAQRGHFIAQESAMQTDQHHSGMLLAGREHVRRRLSLLQAPSGLEGERDWRRAL